jgi:hypothetical protein
MLEDLAEPSDREPVVKRSPSPHRGEGRGEGGRAVALSDESRNPGNS